MTLLAATNQSSETQHQSNLEELKKSSTAPNRKEQRDSFDRKSTYESEPISSSSDVSRTFPSSYMVSTYSKDKNWKKLKPEERLRLRKRIIRDMVKVETNVLRNKTVDHLQEAKQTAHEIQETIESNKITKMVE